MPDPLQWFGLDGPAPYGGPQAFAPVVPDDRHYFTRKESRKRAIEDDQTARQTRELQLQALMDRRRQEQEAVNALPYFQALDPYAEDYQTKRAQVMQRAPGALLNPGLRDTLQGYDYTNRTVNQPDRHVESILNEHPELQDDFETEAATLGPASATKNLRWRASDRTMEKRLGEFGFDFSDPKANETLQNLRHPDKPYLDPVRVESWIKKNGTKGLETRTPDQQASLLGKLSKVRVALADPTIDAGVKEMLVEQENMYKGMLGGTSVTPSLSGPAPYGGVAPQAPPVTLDWQSTKDKLASLFLQEAGGDPMKVQEMLRNPSLRSQVLKKHKLAGQKAFDQDRRGTDKVTFDEVLDAMMKDDGFLKGQGVDPLKARGSTERDTELNAPVQPGQTVGATSRGFTIKRN